MIVAGFGFSARATRASLASALANTGFCAQPDALATLAPKAPQLAAAAPVPAPVVAVDPARLAGVATPTRSPQSLAAHSTGSVAEATALIAAGPGAALLRGRAISDDRLATCAIARQEAAP